MKKIFFATIYLHMITGMAAANPEVIHRVLKDTTTFVALELTNKTVFCTPQGYGSDQLKVSVPDLDHLAHFDHRVVGEGLPCIAAGECSDVLKPGVIIDPNEPLGIAPIRVTLSEELLIDYEKKTCHSRLDEIVRSHIRGRNFFHYRSGDSVPVPFDKCLKIRDL